MQSNLHCYQDLSDFDIINKDYSKLLNILPHMVYLILCATPEFILKANYKSSRRYILLGGNPNKYINNVDSDQEFLSVITRRMFWHIIHV